MDRKLQKGIVAVLIANLVNVAFSFVDDRDVATTITTRHIPIIRHTNEKHNITDYGSRYRLTLRRRNQAIGAGGIT